MSNSDEDQNEKRIIIEGVTDSGKKFRPTDWAERMSGSLCTFRNRRIVYSPLLQPIYKEGFKCLAIDPKLKQTNPEVYQSLLDFAKANQLRICQEDQEP